jgi:hypothetical protein
MKEEKAIKEKVEASTKKKGISSVVLCEVMKLEDSFCSTQASLFQEASDRGMNLVIYYISLQYCEIIFYMKRLLLFFLFFCE